MPPSLVPEGYNMRADIAKTLDLFKYCNQASFRPIRLSNCQKTNPHGEKVIAEIMKLSKDDADFSRLEDFIRLWRSDFLEGMKPKFLPKGWNVEHKMQRSFGEKSVFNKSKP